MKKNLILTSCIIALALPFSSALANDPLALQVSRVGDIEMGCGQISQEAVLMRDIIITTEDIKDGSKFRNRGITAAGAIGSFLVGTATGGIGIAAAGMLLKNATESTKEEADHIQDIAEQRRSFMVGIYHAKGCEGPLEHAMLEELEPYISVASVEPAAGELKDSTAQQTYNQ